MSDPDLDHATCPQLLHDYFEAAAAKWPDVIAIDVPPGFDRSNRCTITYADLKRRSDNLARKLRPLVACERIAAILLNRDSELIYISQLAILNAGAAYLCIDPSFPDKQIREILVDSEAVVVLTDRGGLSRAKELDFGTERCIDVTAIGDQTAEPTELPPSPPWLKPDTLAYIIYTSGSTGHPKGVMIEHRSIANLVRSDLDEFGLGPGDRVAQGSSASYDSSVEETWLALASGATLVVMGDGTARLGPDLVPWLREERISVLCPPPTLLRTTGCNDPEIALPDLKLLYVGGEPLTSDVSEVWGRGRRLVNGYGPTECTVTATRCDVTPGEPINIGRPVPGMVARIVNEDLSEVPSGECGELCLFGVGLARGYYNSPELTATKFCEHRLYGRMYRTGDLASMCENGNIEYHGRIDSQVKLRGYRIELEAIEMAIASHAGVREAACCVQSSAGRDDLAAYIVPANRDSPPTFAEIRSALVLALPEHLVPSRLGYLNELPRTSGGKLNRKALPPLELHPVAEMDAPIEPRNALETRIQAAFQQSLGINEDISVVADFFTDLGGNSLLAAQFVTLLRTDPDTASVTVRDVYEARTIERLAGRVRPMASGSIEWKTKGRTSNAAIATPLQAAWLFAELVLGSAIAAVLAVTLLPWLFLNVGLVQLILSLPLLAVTGLAIYTPISLLFAVAVKRALIGGYEACREPVWGSFFVRNWMVQQVVHLIPWRTFEGTELTNIALRVLGARIGKRVHFHRGTVPLNGGWDLLSIGDDVTISQDATLRLMELEAGDIVVGPITLGVGVTIGVRAGLAPGVIMGEGSYLTSLSSLTSGTITGANELWDGIPALVAGSSPQPPVLLAYNRRLNPVEYAAALIAARFALSVLVMLPAGVLLVLLTFSLRLDRLNAVQMLTRGAVLSALGITTAFIVAATPLTLAFEALAARLMGEAAESVIDISSTAYIVIWLKSGLVESAGRWLSGTVFWPVWLKLAGMRVGPNCEISTIIDVVPELVDIESDCFLADGIYLAPPDIHRGTVSLSRVRLSRNTFVGNHAVIPCGQSLPEDILLGVCTVADQRLIRGGSSWFGLPPFELPRRDIVECDRSLTHNPSAIRYLNRVFWEILRFVVPAGPACAAVAWIMVIGAMSTRWTMTQVSLVAAPMVTAGIATALASSVILLKWALLGEVRPGTHALWSCWCSRWDFHYVIWGEWARPIFASLEGTLLLNVVLRTLGMKIGRRVALGSGFAQVVDPDMIKIGDGATVNAMFQAHTFEDRVLKIGEINVQPYATLASATVPLYGAEIGENTIVTAHGVVMKHERLLPGVQYQGAPTHPIPKGLPG
jgi:non-ribosomal peptide synthetase-like protein